MSYMYSRKSLMKLNTLFAKPGYTFKSGFPSGFIPVYIARHRQILHETWPEFVNGQSRKPKVTGGEVHYLWPETRDNITDGCWSFACHGYIPGFRSIGDGYREYWAEHGENK